MRILYRFMNIDTWLAKRPELLVSLTLLLFIDIYFTLGAGTTNALERPRTWVLSINDEAGDTLLLGSDDPKFLSGEFDILNAAPAAGVHVRRDFVGIMGFSIRSKYVWVHERIPTNLIPRARDAAIEEYLRQGGSATVAAQLRRGDKIAPNLIAWVLPVHLLTMLFAIPLICSALFRWVRHGLREAISNDRIRLGLCPGCKYDLRGITSAVCPECGTKTPSKSGVEVTVSAKKD